MIADDGFCVADDSYCITNDSTPGRIDKPLRCDAQVLWCFRVSGFCAEANSQCDTHNWGFLKQGKANMSWFSTR